MKYLLLVFLLYGCNSYTPIHRADLDKYDGLVVEDVYPRRGMLVIRFTNGDSMVVMGGGTGGGGYFGIVNNKK